MRRDIVKKNYQNNLTGVLDGNKIGRKIRNSK